MSLQGAFVRSFGGRGLRGLTFIGAVRHRIAEAGFAFTEHLNELAMLGNLAPWVVFCVQYAKHRRNESLQRALSQMSVAQDVDRCAAQVGFLGVFAGSWID